MTTQVSSELTFDVLRKAVNEGVAFRCRRRLQPAGGPGDKVFPPTYEGGKYATETRVIDGERIPCVLLDSVQSQANRMELALKAAYYRPGAVTAEIPIVAVDFPSADLPEVGWITSLDAPHRIADAILRDSLYKDHKFRETEEGKAFTEATGQNATALFGLCPLALTLGMWDSTGPKGGLGTKIQRALVSEIVAINAETGKRTSSRIDPLNIALGAGPVYKTKDGGWHVAKEGKNSGKGDRPSEVNHGNVTPSISEGGITCDYALQTTVLSLTALRRLHFPVKKDEYADVEARTALAALGLCGAVLAQSDADLRSRCLLVPEAPAVWENIAADGAVNEHTLDAQKAKALFAKAVAEAKSAGLPWRSEVLVLQPSSPLVELVRRSRHIQMAQPAEA